MSDLLPILLVIRLRPSPDSAILFVTFNSLFMLATDNVLTYLKKYCIL
uniref:Uncharacterized protein n=1 Tax=Anguilla anguilla TaxID=7936 RepID=A0A0E9SXG9_ANGAN